MRLWQDIVPVSSALHAQVAGSTTAGSIIIFMKNAYLAELWDLYLILLDCEYVQPIVVIYLFDAFQVHFEYTIRKVLVYELNGT